MDQYYWAIVPSDYTASARPSDAVTQPNVKIREMVLVNQKKKVREIADATRISTERKRHILDDILKMTKSNRTEVRLLFVIEA